MEKSKYAKFAKYLVFETLNSLVFDFPGKKTYRNSKNIMITCEHAGNQLPNDVSWLKEEQKANLPNSHWAYDPGAAEISLELGEEIGCPVVLSKLSRLYVDVNRPLTSETIMRSQCDEVLVNFNTKEKLTDTEIMQRLTKYYIPYYLSLKNAYLLYKPRYILSLHSFTDNYEGQKREVETGVLDSLNDDLATLCYDTLSSTFYSSFSEAQKKVLLQRNEPWSGKKGLIYAADSLVAAAGVDGKRTENLMLEFRNDKLTDKIWRKDMISNGLLPFVQKLEPTSKL